MKEDISEISNTLTMLGFEVESYESWGDRDKILDISITPNRGDCLSIIGLARELSAYYNLEVKIPDVYNEVSTLNPPDIKVEDIEGCPRYIGWTLDGVKNEKTSEIILYRLDACGFRSVNPIVDITNYVLIEMGQPLHAFDLERLSGEKIIVRRARVGESIKLIDGSDVNLSTDDLVIADAEKPVAIAGVMGSLDTEVGRDTKRILLESAIFDYRSIRRTSKRHNIISSASYRFERIVGYSSPDLGSRRAIYLMLKYGIIGSVSKPMDVHSDTKKRKIYINFNRISELIGQDIDYENTIKKLSKIGIEIKGEKDREYVIPPDFRPDIEREADISEEVARLIGYDKIKSTLPTGAYKPPEHEPLYIFFKKLRKTLNSLGLYENISYSFFGRNQLSTIDYNIDNIKDIIKVRNPVSEDLAYLRNSLIPSLINAVIYNHRRNIDTVPLYEIANIYYLNNDKFTEETMLGIVLYGIALPRTWLSKDERFTIYHLKGIIETVLYELGVNNYSFIEGRYEFVEDKHCLNLLINKDSIGFIGKVKESIRDKIKLGDDIFISEIKVRPLMENAVRIRRITLPPQFPAVFRDLSIIADEKIRVVEIINKIVELSSGLLVDIVLYDVYKGKGIPSGNVGLTFALTFQSKDRTLTDDDVHRSINKILNNLKEQFGIVLREKL
ncbi:MAG: phenylalanine--tRNA ligase subunit beta [bacterium]